MSDPIEPDPQRGTGAGGGDSPPGGNGEGNGGPRSIPERFGWAPLAAGAAVLVGYALFLGYMRDQVWYPEPYWSRMVFLFGSVEAMAFAAAGFLFGREVNRGRAQAAESLARSEADRANQAVQRAATATVHGEALAFGVRSLARDGGADASVERLGGGDVHARLVLLARQAERWFPAA
jgi:hypothetical protein